MKLSSVATALLCVALLHPAPAASQATTTPGAAGTWTIDVTHSELTFSIRHLVSRVRGQFNRWNAAITGSLDNWERAAVVVTIDATSVDTNNDRRDADLRGADFFDVERTPNVTFRSTRIERVGERVRVTGDLTIRDVTRPVTLEGSFAGTTRDQRGRTRAGFEVSGTINRKDFGIVWNRAIEAGGLLLGDDVRIEAVIAAVQQQ